MPEPGRRWAACSREDGYLVRTAASGARGARVRRASSSPDTVVCDFVLPGHRRPPGPARACGTCAPGCFFIMVTAGCGDGEAERALRAEADLFLDKPVDLSRLRAVLRERLGPAGAAAR